MESGTELYSINVQGFSKEFTEERLKELLSKFGDVVECCFAGPSLKAPHHEKTRAIVKFTSKMEAATAIARLDKQPPFFLTLDWTGSQPENEYCKKLDGRGDRGRLSVLYGRGSVGPKRYRGRSMDSNNSRDPGHPLYVPAARPEPCANCFQEGRLRCSRCKTWYCTVVCQENHWTRHRDRCFAPPPLENPDGSIYDAEFDVSNIKIVQNNDSESSSDEVWISARRSWMFLGIKFCPLIMPLERRLQTFALLWWITSFITLGIMTSLTMYLLLYTRLWWLSPLYLTWMVYDMNTCHRGGRRGFLVDWVRGWRLWQLYANFFPIELIKTVELDPTKNYLLGSHPHGVLCSGAACCFATDAAEFKEVFPGLEPRMLTLTMFFNIPGHRELAYSLGFSAASRPNLDCLLSRPGGGVAAVLVVGGAREALVYNTTEGKITLIIRKGFIKIAMKNGCDLVPTFSFGESSIYKNPPNKPGSMLRIIQELILKYTGFPVVLVLGRGVLQYSVGLIPRRIPINVVVGAPIPVEKISEPTPEEVDELHTRYIEALQKLFNEHKEAYGQADLTLDINPED